MDRRDDLDEGQLREVVVILMVSAKEPAQRSIDLWPHAVVNGPGDGSVTRANGCKELRVVRSGSGDDVGFARTP